MKDTIHTDIVRTEDDVVQVLSLLRKNLPSVLNAEQMESQGFVTVNYDPALLLSMNRAAPSVIAKEQDMVVGYCIVLLHEFAEKIPILEPMFRLLQTLSYKNQPLTQYTYFVMGQVCVAKEFRGRGVFDALYAKLREVMQKNYDFVLTEVASRNIRSIKAHLRVGFQIIRTYTDTKSGEVWEIMVWDWRKAEDANNVQK